MDYRYPTKSSALNNTVTGAKNPWVQLKMMGVFMVQGLRVVRFAHDDNEVEVEIEVDDDDDEVEVEGVDDVEDDDEEIGDFLGVDFLGVEVDDDVEDDDEEIEVEVEDDDEEIGDFFGVDSFGVDMGVLCHCTCNDPTSRFNSWHGERCKKMRQRRSGVTSTICFVIWVLIESAWSR